jgi:RHS repeat-associated protein
LEADVVTATDYYPFGMAMPGRNYESQSSYRYGFNGKENSPEISGGALSFEARIYDSRIGRFFSTDPREAEYAWQSTYVYFKNCPISVLDFKGKGKEQEDPDPKKIKTKVDDKVNAIRKSINKVNNIGKEVVKNDKSAISSQEIEGHPTGLRQVTFIPQTKVEKNGDKFTTILLNFKTENIYNEAYSAMEKNSFIENVLQSNAGAGDEIIKVDEISKTIEYIISQDQKSLTINTIQTTTTANFTNSVFTNSVNYTINQKVEKATQTFTLSNSMRDGTKLYGVFTLNTLGGPVCGNSLHTILKVSSNTNELAKIIASDTFIDRVARAKYFNEEALKENGKAMIRATTQPYKPDF